jgi:hypothetical protein
MNEAKPFCISKKEVWEAYKRVKANKGAAGVDEQSIEDFEKKLKKNLYKIWNRLAVFDPQPRANLPTSRLHRTDISAPANTTDATSAIRFRAGRVFPAFAAILIPASVLSKKSARLSRSV